MKKLLFVPLIIALNMSCSSDDNSNTNNITGSSSFVANDVQYEFPSENFYFYSPQDSTLVLSLGGEQNNYNVIGISLPYNGSNVQYNSNSEVMDDVNFNYTNEQTGVAGYSLISSSLGDPLNLKGRFDVTVSSMNEGRISGTFNFVAYSDNQKDSIVVKNGTFKEVSDINNM